MGTIDFRSRHRVRYCHGNTLVHTVRLHRCQSTQLRNTKNTCKNANATKGVTEVRATSIRYRPTGFVYLVLCGRQHPVRPEGNIVPKSSVQVVDGVDDHLRWKHGAWFVCWETEPSDGAYRPNFTRLLFHEHLRGYCGQYEAPFDLSSQRQISPQKNWPQGVVGLNKIISMSSDPSKTEKGTSPKKMHKNSDNNNRKAFEY